jgi:hypothetical protein
MAARTVGAARALVRNVRENVDEGLTIENSEEVVGELEAAG